jgi:RNA polymerase sigma-70 factor (ECF subfamily)
VTQWKQVLAEVVRERRSALVGYAVLLTLNWVDAEDVVQEAFVRTFARRRSFPDARAAEAYVRQAVRTVFLDGVRRRKAWGRRAHLFVTDGGARSPEDAVAARIDVRQALGLLAPRERACILLRFFDDMGIAETATELGLSTGAVKRYLADGAAKLREALGESVTWRDEELYEAPVAITTVSGGSGS